MVVTQVGLVLHNHPASSLGGDRPAGDGLIYREPVRKWEKSQEN